MSIPFWLSTFTADSALFGVAIGLCLSFAVVGYEWFALVRSGAAGTGGLFDWGVLRLRRSVLTFRPLRALDWVLSRRAPTMTLLIVGVACSAGVVVTWGTVFTLWLALLSTLFLLVLALRFPLGRDGSDQLLLVLSLAVLGYSVRPSELSAAVFAGLICAHLVVGYEISGVTKLAGKPWRSGRALGEILSTRCYGWPALGAALPQWALATAGWSVMIFEATFIAVLIPWPPVGLAVIALGVLFHFGTWLTMGLNSFFVGYVGAYPVLIWMVFALHR